MAFKTSRSTFWWAGGQSPSKAHSLKLTSDVVKEDNIIENQSTLLAPEQRSLKYPVSIQNSKWLLCVYILSQRDNIKA